MLKFFVATVGIIMALGNYPQAYKIYKNKSSRDISLIAYFIACIGSAIWLAYGLYIGEWPIVISLAVGLSGSLSVLILTLYYRKK